MFNFVQKLPWFIRALILRPFFARLGGGSYLGPPVYLSGIKSADIGRNFRVFPGLRLEILKGGRLAVGDDVAIAQNVHITCGKSLTIGAGCRILPNVIVTDIAHEYRSVHVPLRHQPDRMSRVVIGDNCIIGAGAVVLPGVELGNNCVVGANAVVRGNFAPFSVIAGPRANRVGRYAETTKEWKWDREDT
jgi:acetyltransferase-like isoleucine patch superfamily enzyme